MLKNNCRVFMGFERVPFPWKHWGKQHGHDIVDQSLASGMFTSRSVPVKSCERMTYQRSVFSALSAQYNSLVMRKDAHQSWLSALLMWLHPSAAQIADYEWRHAACYWLVCNITCPLPQCLEKELPQTIKTWQSYFQTSSIVETHFSVGLTPFHIPVMSV